MKEENYRYVKIDASWYNELLRSKARYDFFIDSLIASNLKDYDAYLLSDAINNYYFKMGNPVFI